MEGQRQFQHFSTTICESLLLNNIVQKVSKLSPLPQKVGEFSSTNVNSLTSQIMWVVSAIHADPPKQFQQDQTSNPDFVNNFQVRTFAKPSRSQKRSQVQYRQSTKSLISLQQSSRIQDKRQVMPIQQDSMFSEAGEQAIVDRLRQIKMHQQLHRLKAQESMRKTRMLKKKTVIKNKLDSKNNSVRAYDYDGMLIELNPKEYNQKPLPHFVSIDATPKVRPEGTPQSTPVTRKQKKSKKENQLSQKIQPNVKLKQPKKTSFFIRDLSNIKWADGVTLYQPQKQRKSIGGLPSKSTHKSTKSMLQLGQIGPNIKFSDFQKYKSIKMSECGSSTAGLSALMVQKNTKSSLLKKQGGYLQIDSNLSKFIKVGNNKAMQYLMCSSSCLPEQQIRTQKKVAFAQMQ